MSLPELARTPWGAASLVCEALALAGMAPFMYIEATTLREYGLHGWLSAWNVMDVIAYAVQARPGMLDRDFRVLGSKPLISGLYCIWTPRGRTAQWGCTGRAVPAGIGLRSAGSFRSSGWLRTRCRRGPRRRSWPACYTVNTLQREKAC